MFDPRPIKDLFIRTELPFVPKLDSHGVRLSVHDQSQRTVDIRPTRLEGRLLVFEDDPKRIVVVSTDQFNVSGSANSLMAFCHMIDETVSTMMAYGFPLSGEAR